MTEVEWLASDHPAPMLHFLRGRVRERKLRLFAIACCRRIWELLSDRQREAIEVVERYTIGKATAQQRQSAHLQVRWEGPAHETTSKTPRAITAAVVCADQWARKDPSKYARIDFLAECRAQVDLLRDVIGDPFHPVTLNPDWLEWNNGAVIRISQRIDAEQSFGDLPILADALEDAGCENADILSHLRGPGPHVRGCWVLDLLLGKE